MPTAQAAPMSLLFIGVATAIMWVSAGIVGVTRPTLSRAFLATIGVSLIAGAVVTSLSAFGPILAVLLGLVGLIGCVWVIRTIFQIPTLPALLIFIVNIMVQMILVSLYVRAMMSTPASK